MLASFVQIHQLVHPFYFLVVPYISFISNAMKEVWKTSVGLILNQFIQFVDHLRIVLLTLIIILRFREPCCFAGPGNTHLVVLYQISNNCASVTSAYHFFERTSLSILLSKDTSAYICLSRWFSSWSCFS